MLYDIKKQIPEHFLEHKRASEFLDVVNETLNEIIIQIQDENKLYEATTTNNFLIGLLKNFGIGTDIIHDKETSAFIAKEAKSFIGVKSSEVFMENIFSLYNAVYDMVDLGTMTMMLSQHEGVGYNSSLSCANQGGMLQDSSYWRDGSMLCNTTMTQYHVVDILLQKYITAGCYVWYHFASDAFGGVIKLIANATSNIQPSSNAISDIFSFNNIESTNQYKNIITLYGVSGSRDPYAVISTRHLYLQSI